MLAGITDMVSGARSGRRTMMFALAFAFAALGCIGLGLRIAGEPSRVFWTDEAITALRTSGHTAAEFVASNVDGKPHSVADILRYTGRGDRRGSGAVVTSLALEDAQHPPLYYLVTQLWTHIAGVSIAQIRVPALVFGLLVPAAVAWLCWELYANVLAAFCGFALAGVSPVLVIYSQQAREYSAWALAFAVLSALFLRAARSESKSWWILYALCAAAGLYTDVLIGVTLVSHAAVAVVLLRGRRLLYSLAAVGAALAAFAPWAVEIYEHRSAIAESNAWTATPWPVLMLLEKWAFNAGSAFWDLEYLQTRLAIVVMVFAALVAIAVVWNLSRPALRTRVTVAALIAAPIVMLFLPDLIVHEHRSSVTRYGMPLWIAILACVAGFLASRIRTGAQQRRAAWAAAAVLVVALCAVSSVVDARAAVWWDNRQDGSFPAIATAIDAAPHPIVIVPRQWARALDLALYLQPDVAMVLPLSDKLPHIPRSYESVYLLANDREEKAIAAQLRGLSLSRVYGENANAQVAQFRGTGADPDALVLWRINR